MIKTRINGLLAISLSFTLGIVACSSSPAIATSGDNLEIKPGECYVDCKSKPGECDVFGGGDSANNLPQTVPANECLVHNALSLKGCKDKSESGKVTDKFYTDDQQTLPECPLTAGLKDGKSIYSCSYNCKQGYCQVYLETSDPNNATKAPTFQNVGDPATYFAGCTSNPALAVYCEHGPYHYDCAQVLKDIANGK